MNWLDVGCCSKEIDPDAISQSLRIMGLECGLKLEDLSVRILAIPISREGSVEWWGMGMPSWHCGSSRMHSSVKVNGNSVQRHISWSKQDNHWFLTSI